MSLHPFKTICVMGLGYIGLPTATLIASRGLKVIGVDKNQHAIDTINQGKIHIVEPDLEGLVTKVVSDGSLKAYDHAQEADIFIITVPTPITEDKQPDMSYVDSALEEIAGQLQKNNLVIIESTSPVGTTDSAAKLLSEKRPDLTFPHTHGEESDIRMAYCPERVLPGQIITELMNNDRIIGGMTPKCAELAKRFYHVFVRGECHIGTHNTAELVKLSENAYRDVNIAFANELSNVCDHHDIDVSQLVKFANLHPRVNILNPGPGVGGHCIPVDPWFIVAKAPEHTPLIKTARNINDNRPHQAADKILAHLKDNPNAKIACLGLAYKPNVDDLRESPALEIVSDIAKSHGEKLFICEPHIKELPEQLAKFNNIEFTDALTAIGEADIIATLVNHRTFGYVDKQSLASKVVLDFCGVWNKALT